MNCKNALSSLFILVLVITSNKDSVILKAIVFISTVVRCQSCPPSASEEDSLVKRAKAYFYKHRGSFSGIPTMVTDLHYKRYTIIMIINYCVSILSFSNFEDILYL